MNREELELVTLGREQWMTDETGDSWRARALLDGNGKAFRYIGAEVTEILRVMDKRTNIVRRLINWTEGSYRVGDRVQVKGDASEESGDLAYRGAKGKILGFTLEHGYALLELQDGHTIMTLPESLEDVEPEFPNLEHAAQAIADLRDRIDCEKDGAMFPMMESTYDSAMSLLEQARSTMMMAEYHRRQGT